MGSILGSCFHSIDLSIAGLGALGAILVTTILQAIALGTDYWIQADPAAGHQALRMGVFQYCAPACQNCES